MADAPSNQPIEPGRVLSTSASHLTGWRRWLPGLRVLREYQLTWLPKDLMAGLVLITMLVPVGIAYAEASGVPGI
ncbi:MAG: putative sulfate transporter [Pseudomonas sp.]|nr:putative sulfate transporter [Pseudomonas sp.]